MSTTEKTTDRNDFTSPRGIARWWSKDGAWHIARPCPDPDPATGLKTGGFRYDHSAYDSRDEAILALEKTTLHLPGRTDILPHFKVGDLVKSKINTGPIYRVTEVVTEVEGALITVKVDRDGGCEYRLMDSEKFVPYPPKNDAETLMRECLEHEAKQRAEIAATPVRGCEEMRRREATTPVRLVREEMGAGFVLRATDEAPEHRATAFVSGLQQARIDALEAALRHIESNMRGDGYFERTCRHAVDSVLA